MYNHYQGNTGRVSREGEPESVPRRAQSMPDGHMRSAAVGQHGTQQEGRTRGEARPRQGASQPGHMREPPAAKPRPQPNGGGPPPETGGGPLSGLLGNLSGVFSGILPKVLPDGLETGDLMLLLILYLMYKESGDKELLIILGAMFLL